MSAVPTVKVLVPRPGALSDVLGDDADAVDALNLAGDYAYLSSGYYASLDAELAGERMLPSPEEALDAYVVPILMDKARRAGLPVPEATLVTERFPEPPFMAWPVNPFSTKGELILDEATLAARRGGLTYAGKYAVACQRLPADHRLDTARVVLGRCAVPELAELAAAAFRALRLPAMRLRVVVSADAYLVAAVEPLPFDVLTGEELGWLEEAGTWRD